MKALNKFLSLILFCAMVMSLCIPAFASERMSSEELDTPFIMDIDNGKLFSAESDDKIVAILTNDDLHLIDISISYSPARDEVYHWAISDYPDDEFSYNDSFWTAIITYDDQYLYLTNAIRYMDYQGTVPAEGRGIMVYDFHGNLQQFIPMTQEVGNAMFLLSTPDYVFFYDDSTHSCHPAWYIEKSAIASNSAKMLPVE